MTNLVSSVSLRLNSEPVAVFDDHLPQSSLSSEQLVVTCPYFEDLQLRYLPGRSATLMTACE
jgi:hypothetical protein